MLNCVSHDPLTYNESTSCLKVLSLIINKKIFNKTYSLYKTILRSIRRDTECLVSYTLPYNISRKIDCRLHLIYSSIYTDNIKHSIHINSALISVAEYLAPVCIGTPSCDSFCLLSSGDLQLFSQLEKWIILWVRRAGDSESGLLAV